MDQPFSEPEESYDSKLNYESPFGEEIEFPASSSRQEFPVGHTYYVDTTGARRPLGARIQRPHKVTIGVPKPSVLRQRLNLGRLGHFSMFTKSDIDGRIAAALDKLFRSKSQAARFVLEILQRSLVGHLLQVPRVFSDSARYLRTAEGLVQITSKPSFRAVRLLILSLKESSRTTFRLPDCVRQSLQRTGLLLTN
jgi:hypothetical protein